MTAGMVREIAEDQYTAEVLEGGKVVLDFYSTECPPCEALASKYEGLSLVYGEDVRFLKIFRQGNRSLAESLRVASSPTLLFYDEGKLLEGRLTGGIHRSQIAQLLEQMLPQERVQELHSRIAPVATQCDALVLGGGPAGLTAGIYLAQAHIKTVIVDTALPGGFVATTHQVSNYPGFPDALNGYMLSHFMSEQAKKAGVAFRVASDVSAVDLERKEVLLDGYETLRARAIILATGSTPRPLGIPGEKEYRGRGISYCATCDAKYFEGKDVVVIGGGNSAVEESLFIARFARTVTIVHQFSQLQANKEAQTQAFENPRIQFLFEHEPRAFIRHGDMDMEVTVENLRDASRRGLRANGVFVFVGFIANVFPSQGELRRDAAGYILTDERMRTNLPGVYAVGDVRVKPYRQITTATADGTIAAIAISQELA
ncbi:MAG TPA: FAD-dependent oxidoreductase [Spirochaetia bacterium]|nr:FAD-dependent oxidoreductase [Spirochaetia bacterium]